MEVDYRQGIGKNCRVGLLINLVSRRQIDAKQIQLD